MSLDEKNTILPTCEEIRTELMQRKPPVSQPLNLKEDSKPAIEKPSQALLNLLKELADAGASVVLWKGRDRLERSLSGDGDLDLLIAEESLPLAKRILKNRGFRQAPTSEWRRLPFVEDWYGVDPDQPKLLHIQLYEKLVLGDLAATVVCLPNAAQLIDHAVACGPNQSAACDSDAAVLRLCRAALAHPLLPGRSRLELLKEAKSIAKIVPEGGVGRAATRLFDPDTASIIEAAFASGKLKALKNRLAAFYQCQDTTPKCVGRVRRWITAVLSAVNRRTLKWSMLPRRALRRPSPVVALIGSDGAGKSTVSRRVAAILDSKIDTRLLYFGTGDGPVSLLRRPLVWLRRLLRPNAGKESNQAPNPATAEDGAKRRDDGPLMRLAKIAWAVTVVIERRSKARQARRAANAGVVVVCDRYPQAEFDGIHDGPRLGAWRTGKRGWMNRFAEWEQREYLKIIQSGPDLVMLLDVGLEQAMARRPEESRQELTRRIEVARKLSYGGSPRIVIDAGQALDSVVAEALQKVIREALT